MASETTPTQLAREALTAIKFLETKVAIFQQDVDNAELSKHRERTAVLENQVVQLNAQMQEHKLTRERTAFLENQDTQLLALMEEHKPTRAEAEILGALKIRMTQLEEEKKRDQTGVFQVMILFLGGIITLAIQIVLLFFKK